MNRDMTAFHQFIHIPEDICFPEQFTYPFRYEPHPLCRMAAKEVQHYLEGMTEWKEELEEGKMFGVLVVQKEGRTGFLAAYSGILDGRNDHAYFVPPVYDLLQPDGFFRRGENIISSLNRQIADMEHGHEHADLQEKLSSLIIESERQLSDARNVMKAAKLKRDTIRNTSPDVSQTAGLIRESQHHKAEYKRLEKHWHTQIEEVRRALQRIDTDIRSMKEERKHLSCTLQQQIFSRFIMNNARGERKNLCDIFQEFRGCMPPAGAGECAAPKLLQYAYLHEMHPVAMAEFWWGRSPKTELRRHGYFYPACKSKCEPILSFMLQGLDVEPNPMTEKASKCTEPEIIYEDEWMTAVHKPAGMYSVPGKADVISVYDWAKARYPDSDSPLIVHRLDMDTSGLMLIAKTKEAHARLQQQFENREVRKKYIAVLDGNVEQDTGFVRLPLCPDLSDRPRQMVSDTLGKPAVTRFQVITRQNGQTRIALFPQTGRTHQLRVHAAHQDGLNAPIVGDALYGQMADRLYLHAEELKFRHFATGRMLTLHAPSPF